MVLAGQLQYGGRGNGLIHCLIHVGLGSVSPYLRMGCHQVCQRLTAHQIATVQLLLGAAVAIISLVLSAGFLNFLRVYFLAFFLQSVVETSSIVPLAVLYFDPLADCTGAAASIEILFKSVPPCIYCMVRTPSLIAGIKSFMTLQSCTAASACVFLAPVVHTVLWMFFG